MIPIPEEVRKEHMAVCAKCPERKWVAKRVDFHVDWLDCFWDCPNDYEHWKAKQAERSENNCEPQTNRIADKKPTPIRDFMVNGKVKDEPQTDCDGCQHYADEYTADACYECSRSYADCYEPQTERSK